MGHRTHYIVHNTPYTVHRTQYTVYRTQYTLMITYVIHIRNPHTSGVLRAPSIVPRYGLDVPGRTCMILDAPGCNCTEREEYLFA